MKTIDFIIQSIWLFALLGFAIFGNNHQANDVFLYFGYYFRFSVLLVLTLFWQLISGVISNDRRTRVKHPVLNAHAQMLVLLGYIMVGSVLLIISALLNIGSGVMKTWMYCGMPVVTFGWLACSAQMRDSWAHFREFGHTEPVTPQQQVMNQYMQQQYMQQQQYMNQQQFANQQQQYGNQQQQKQQ